MTRAAAVIELELPVPASPNRWNDSEILAHQYRTWLLACSQCEPEPAPPEFVKIHATFYLDAYREDKPLRASLAYTLEALKRVQPDAGWRNGLHPDRGYFVENDSDHLEVEVLRQVRPPANGKPFLLLEIYFGTTVAHPAV